MRPSCRHTFIRVVYLVLAGLLLAGAPARAWSVQNDYSNRDIDRDARSGITSGIREMESQEGGVNNSVITQAINTFRVGFGRLLQVVMGLGAIVTLVLIVYKMMRGDRESLPKMAMWVLGFAVGLALLSILANQQLNVSAGKHHGEFGAYQLLLANSFISLLMIVAMFSLVSVVRSIMKGDYEGLDKFFKWMLTCCAGMNLIAIFA